MRIGKVSLAAAAAVATVGSIAAIGITGASTFAASSRNESRSTTPPLVMSPGPYGSYTANFNPFSTSNNPGTDGFVYEPLFYFSTVSSNQYGLLGQSYKWTNNGKTLTVTLRQGVKWTNGSAFSSKDVVFTFDLLKKNPALDTSGLWTKLASVQAPNSSTVVFNFKQTDIPFGTYVLETYIVPESIWSKIANPAKFLNSHPVGTGPYELHRFTSQNYSYTPNPHYYLGKPKVPMIEFPAYDSNNALNTALAAGQIQWSGQFMPDIKGVYTSKSPTNHYWFAPYEVVGLFPDLKNPMMTLPVRKAIEVALNRSLMGTHGEYGYEKPASPTGLVLPAQKSYLAKGVAVHATYNPKEAVKILESAGYKKNSAGNFVSPSGKPLTLTMQVPSGWSNWDADCAMMAQELSAIGIPTTVQQDSYGEYVANLNGHKFSLAMTWTNPGPTPYYALYNALDSKGNWNVEGWSNGATNRALNQYSSTTNPAQQVKAIQTLEGIMEKDVPFIPILDGALWDEYNTANYVGWPTQSHPYVTNAPYSWPAPEIVVMHLKPRH